MHQLEFLFTLQSFITLLLCERRRTRTELHFVRTRVGGGGRQEGDPRGYTRRTDGRTDGLGCIRRTFNVQTQLRPALCASVQRSFVRRVFALERSGWRTHGHSGRTQGPNGRTSEEGRGKKSALFLSLSLSLYRGILQVGLQTHSLRSSSLFGLPCTCDPSTKRTCSCRTTYTHRTPYREQRLLDGSSRKRQERTSAKLVCVGRNDGPTAKKPSRPKLRP